MMPHAAPADGREPTRPAAEQRFQPRIVALGGGTGLPNVLRGLRPLLATDGLSGGDGGARERLVAVVDGTPTVAGSPRCACRKGASVGCSRSSWWPSPSTRNTM